MKNLIGTTLKTGINDIGYIISGYACELSYDSDYICSPDHSLVLKFFNDKKSLFFFLVTR